MASFAAGAAAGAALAFLYWELDLRRRRRRARAEPSGGKPAACGPDGGGCRSDCGSEGRRTGRKGMVDKKDKKTGTVDKGTVDKKDKKTGTVDKGTVDTAAAPPRKKRVAVYGGSFNPITDGHLQMAANVIHTGAADEVWIVPCGPRPDKPSMTTSARDRLTLCHCAVETCFSSSFPIKVDDEEIERPRALTTPRLLDIYDKKYGDTCEFHFVVGTDLLEGLPFWDPKKEYEGWYKTRGLIVMDRPGYPRPEAWAHAKNARFLYADDSLRAGGAEAGRGDKRGGEGAGRSGGVRQLRPQEVRGQTERHFVPASISSSEVRKRIAHLEHDRLSEIFGSGLRLTEGLTGMAVLNFIKRQGLFGAKGNRSGGVGGAFGQKNTTLLEKDEEERKEQQQQEQPHHQTQEGGSKIRTTLLRIPPAADAAALTPASTATTATATDTTAPGPVKLLQRRNSSVEGIVYGVAGGASYDVVMKRRQPAGARRVALFGGSFDPMTTAHLKMVAEIIHTAAADEVWIVPCGKRPDKPAIVSRLHRYTMCQLAVVTTFSSEFPVYVRDDDIHHCAEGEGGGSEEAMDTPALIELMKHKYPNAEFSFVIGSNLIKDLPHWHYTKESHKKWWLDTPLIVMPRLGYPVPEDVARRPDVIIVGNSDLPAEGSGLVTSDAESSVLRARLQEQKKLGKDSRDDKLWCIQGLVPHAVNSYIMRYDVFV